MTKFNKPPRKGSKVPGRNAMTGSITIRNHAGRILEQTTFSGEGYKAALTRRVLARRRKVEEKPAAEVVALSGGSTVSDAVWDDHLREILDRRRAVYEALADK